MPPQMGNGLLTPGLVHRSMSRCPRPSPQSAPRGEREPQTGLLDYDLPPHGDDFLMGNRAQWPIRASIVDPPQWQGRGGG